MKNILPAKILLLNMAVTLFCLPSFSFSNQENTPAYYEEPHLELRFPVSIPKNDLLVSNRALKDSLDPNNITIFSWNIFKGEKKNWYKDFNELAKLDGIFLIQEYADTDGIDYTLSLQDKKEVVVGLAYKVALWGVTGVSTISSYSSNYRRNFRTKNRENFTLSTYKTSLITKYAISESEKYLLVINVHMMNSVTPEKYLEELNRIGFFISSYDGPVVIAGDYNSWSDRVQIVKQWSKSLGLKEVVFSPDNRTSFEGSPAIDRILYKGLDFRASWSQKVNSSDHNPIGASFSLSK